MARVWVFWFVFFLVPSVRIQARTLTLQDFDAHVRVEPSGDLVVTERIQARFEGSWNGLYRFIPVQYRSPRGLNYRIWIDLESVVDGSGVELRVERTREEHYVKFKIWVPGAMDAVKTVVLRYRVERALRFLEEHDELYWNVTGDEGATPIEAASVRVELPSGVTGVRVAGFTGPHGSKEQSVRAEILGEQVQVRATRELQIREGLTVAVAWNPGSVQRPGLLKEATYLLRANWVLGFPFLVTIFMYSLWRKRGKDPESSPILVRYSPPHEMTPAEMGTLLDHSPDLRDLTATLVDLAVRGFILIEETEREKWFGLASDRSYGFRIQKPAAEWSKLKSFERLLLDGLFEKGLREFVGLDELKNKFYRHLSPIRNEIFSALIDRGFYSRRPDRVKQRYLIAALSAAGLFFFLSQQEFFGIAPTGFVIAGLASAGVIAAFGWFMPARTVRGARTLEEILGFRDFLDQVESDRFRRMITGPEMFEKLLPFAMSLGVEEKWARVFEGLFDQPPKWFRGSDLGGFHTRGLVSNLNRMSAEAATVLASAPRSSGGSGFSGGGSSGGGFGGGGTGGF